MSSFSESSTAHPGEHHLLLINLLSLTEEDKRRLGKVFQNLSLTSYLRAGVQGRLFFEGVPKARKALILQLIWKVRR